MSNMQLELHSENFDYCRLCLLQPEIHRNISFFKIFKRYDELQDLTKPIQTYLGIEVKESDNFPKIICQNCFAYLNNAIIKENTTINNQVVFEYLHKKKYGDEHTSTHSSISFVQNLSTNAMNHSLSTSVLSLSSRSTSVLSSSLPSTNDLPLFSPSTSHHYSRVHSLEKTVTSQSVTQSNVLPSDSNSQSTSGQTSSNHQSIVPVNPMYHNLDNDDTFSVGNDDYTNYSMVHSLEKTVTSESITQANVLPSDSHSQSISNQTSSNHQSIVPVNPMYPNSDNDNTFSVGNDDYTNYSMVHSLEKTVTSESITQANVLPSDSNSQSTSGQTSSNHQLIVPDNVAYQSTDSDDTSIVDNDDYANNMLINCFLCQKYIKYDHNCWEYNNKIATCLVPNCNVVSRTLNEILPHYRHHIVLHFGETLCRVCRRSYQRNVDKICEFDECGSNNISINNVIKCYDCDIVFQTMLDLTRHKLEKHDCVFKHSTGKYICLHCDMASNNMTMIVTHSNGCFANSLNFERYINKKHRQRSTANSSKGERNTQGVLIPKNIKKKNIVNTKNHMLFACIKPSCKKIFISFGTFKNHHRKHFEIQNKLLMCWQCLAQFDSVKCLRMHQKTICRKPDIFACNECSKKHNDLEALSIHKYIFHDGDLKYSKRVKGNFINCKYCKQQTNVNTLKKHLIMCSFNLVKI